MFVFPAPGVVLAPKRQISHYHRHGSGTKQTNITLSQIIFLLSAPRIPFLSLRTLPSFPESVLWVWIVRQRSCLQRAKSHRIQASNPLVCLLPVGVQRSRPHESALTWDRLQMAEPTVSAHACDRLQCQSLHESLQSRVLGLQTSEPTES